MPKPKKETEAHIKDGKPSAKTPSLSKKAPKRFLLDTNILLAFPRAMVEDFADNTVIICGTVIQELNGKKSADGEIGYNAREAGRVLDACSKMGNLTEGVKLPRGGLLLLEPDGVNPKYLPDGFSIDIADNRILSTCKYLTEKDPGTPVILITSDILMRVAATACGVPAQEFKKVMVEDSDYTGHAEVECDWKDIDKIYTDKEIKVKKRFGELRENQFVTLKSGTSAALTVHQEGRLNLISNQSLFGWVRPKNAMQTYAMWALSQPAEKLPLVILDGFAGTGKTLLTLAAGLDGTYTSQRRDQSQYYKMLITRPIGNAFEGQQGMGYLPGSMEDKLYYLYQSYYDNLAILLRGEGKSQETSQQVQTQLDDIFSEGIIEVGGLSFIRGRSLISTYLICDEAQNSSKTLIRDVITRAGAGTKVVIAGDPTQIDVPTLSSRNNGLVAAAETMAGSPLCAYLKLPTMASVRSALAREAIERMTW